MTGTEMDAKRADSFDAGDDGKARDSCDLQSYDLQTSRPADDDDGHFMEKLGWVDRLLSVWIILAVALGIALSFVPPVRVFVTETAVVGSTNVLLAVALVLMMYPPLAKVDYAMLPAILQQPRLFAQSLVLNWVVGPVLMVVLGCVIMGPGQVQYVQGLVLIGIARCIAMVLVWNHLSGGDNNLCAMLVAMNSILQIVLYAVYAAVTINAVLPALGFATQESERIGLGESFRTTLETVAIYLGIPFAMALLSWVFIRRQIGDEAYYEGYCKRIGPLCLGALLFAIVVMFAMQGVTLLQTPVYVLWVAVPLLVYFLLMFVGTFLLTWRLGHPYAQCATMAFTAAGNNFELALAVSVSVYHADSPQAFSCIIGPLVEIPVMLLLVNLAYLFKRRLTFEGGGGATGHSAMP